MAALSVCLSRAASRAISRLIKRLYALEGLELPEAVDTIKATVDPRCLEIVADRLVRQLKVGDAEKRTKAARVLELLGPVAASQLVAHLRTSKDTAFRLRLVDVMIAIVPAAREQLALAFIGLVLYQPDEALREAGWKGYETLGPAGRGAGPRKVKSKPLQ